MRNKIQNKEKNIIILQNIVFSIIDLSLITKQAHWNIKGRNFISIHEMLDSFYSSLIEQQDILAERIVQLYGIAIGLPRDIVKNSIIPEYDSSILDIDDSLNALADRYSILANQVREDIKNVEDEGTADILTVASRELDKMLWFIEAHIKH